VSMQDLSQIFVPSPAESEFAASQRSRDSIGTPKNLWIDRGVCYHLTSH
jgi:hypothetical protein